MTNSLKNEKLGFMSQKILVDKANNTVSEFVVFSSPEFKESDWLSKLKLSEIIAQLADKKVFTYQLKKTVKGSRDNNKKPQDGKAIKFTIVDQNVSISIYSQSTQEKEDKWRLSHTYIIDKRIFDAYVLVMQSDITVAEKEKKQKFLENSSLQLD